MRQHWLVIVIALIAVVLMGGTAVERSVSAQSSRGSSLTAVPCHRFPRSDGGAEMMFIGTLQSHLFSEH